MSLGGDATAFEQLLNRYRDAIFQLYMQRTGGNRDDADDLLQETFVKVYLNLHKYKPGYTFGQWIYTIARNTFIDYVRKRRDDLSLDSMQESGASGMAPTALSPNPEESVINSQQRAQLEHHLGKMTPRYRRLIELRFFKDYSYEEIATELALPLGTVKTQIHRAREQLCRFIIRNTDILP
mgnify:CR=1 FL=1